MMRTAFFIVLLFIAIVAAVDVTWGDKSSAKTENTVAGALGIQPTRRRLGSEIVFLISVAGMSAVLITETICNILGG